MKTQKIKVVEMQENLSSIQEMLSKKIGMNPESLTPDVWKNILERRMRSSGCYPLEAYLEKIKSSPEEFYQLVEEVVVPETWFFRDGGSFEFIAYHIKENYLKKRESILYRILCLPCASGEEPYSVAMALDHAGVPPQCYEIHGIDISRIALNKADRGVYSRNSFRGSYYNYQESFFEQTSDGFQIDARIRTKVFFSHGNIMDDRLSLNVVPYDAVFCRNLFIYLTKEAQHRVFSVLEKLLKQSGILFVAPAEIELARSYGYEPIKFARAFAFKKRKKTVNLTGKKHQELTGRHEVAEMTCEEELEELLPAAMTEEEAVVLAQQHADEGEFGKAEKICMNFIEKRGVNPNIYFLLGLIQHAQGKESRAEDFFLKTIYLNPKHYEALVYLALLCDKNGQPHKAELFRRRAAKVSDEGEESGGQHE